jgi:hypothetical protein
MATMIILFPISGFAAQLLQVIQKGRIKAADKRIGTIQESEWLFVLSLPFLPFPSFIHPPPSPFSLRRGTLHPSY